MGQLAEGLLSLSGWAALAFLFLLPALEAPAFLGLVLPGELAVLLGGVLASQGRIPLGAAVAVGVAGALAVGRGTAGVRVVLPGLAGMVGLRYRTFALWTGAAAIVWGVAHVLLGHVAGAGWRHIYQLTGRVGLALALAVLIGLAVAWLVRRLRLAGS
jgi:membrane protein DedA with SNARE-associated domain